MTLEESKTAEDSLQIVEGMQFERGYISPYFVTDTERMVCITDNNVGTKDDIFQAAEYQNCKLLLVDKKIATARDIISLLEAAIKGGYALLVMAEEIEQEALATLVVNKLRGNLKATTAISPFSLN